ncbi:hypothetical protein J7F03_22925 [Streptomyces sp. ISL-43]|uniref:hypothetical protein n=1 Tax=Streptomyces sp. ISL-43 TaxID=2819183 RepID=UPI001BEC13B5|nr:hypothetical protein [Streptomyces sp. ISL-43]MBT2449874.1 hypothetical protein [Streptomyces sp. ISL-43]
MGGGKHAERGRRGRPLPRRAVLLMAFGVLAGTVFLCARPGTEHGAGHPAAHAPGARHVVCVSPHDLPGCSPLSRVTPGVLPVPPPAALQAASGAPWPGGPPAYAGPARPPRALARGPDLYALQVLRT